MFFNHYSNGYLSAFGTNDELKSMWLEAFDTGFDKQSQKLVEYINTIWDALSEDYSLSRSLDSYRKNLEETKNKLAVLFDSGKLNKNEYNIERWYDCVRMIVSSYVHMMNNRLGVSIKEEAYISHLINKALMAEEFSK